MSDFDFETNPRAWQFTGEVKAVWSGAAWYHFSEPKVDYQLVFEKTVSCTGPHCHTIRIGVTFHEGRMKVYSPPSGEV